jgi:hypothetical protein
MVVCFIVWLNHANKKKTCYNHTSITLVKRKAYLSPVAEDGLDLRYGRIDSCLAALER